MVRTKVFVGNLSFKTKEPELKAHFSNAGNVINVNIITRGPRSLGYGFVEMESEEAANAAVQSLHHKEVDGRQINVELVREPKEGEEVPKKERKPREPRQPKSPAQGSDSKDEADASRDGKPRRQRKPSKKPRDTNEGENVREGTKGEKPARDSKPREPRPERVDKTTGQKEGQSKPAAERKPREPRPKKTTENRTESETLLFVANLPFSLDNDSFSEFVTKQGVAHKTAYVVKKHNNRSKGYGFIELNNQAEQKAAFDKLNGISIEDRALSVKIALTPPVGSEDTQEKQQEKPATQGSSSSSGGNVSSPKPLTPNTNKEQGVKSPKPEGTPQAVKEEKK